MGQKSEDLEGCLFLRKEVGSDDNNENILDDTKLIKAYDKAISKAKRAMLTKSHEECKSSNEEVQGVLSDTSGTKSRKKKKKCLSKKAKWTVGSVCRAIYSEDGEEYEAEIIQMIDHNLCTVRFIGYNNEEDVLLKDLAPSLGSNMIKVQIRTANAYNAALQELLIDSEQDVASNPELIREAPPPEDNGRQSIFNCRPRCPIRRSPMFHTCPPPPPHFRSASFNKFANPLAGARSETLNAMLLSWYMAGYYAGYYQGKQDPMN